MEESRGGRPEVDFEFTLDMAKELAMVERNEKGRQIRQYFIWAETKLRKPARAYVSVAEFCDYTRLPEAEVAAALNRS